MHIYTVHIHWVRHSKSSHLVWGVLHAHSHKSWSQWCPHWVNWESDQSSTMLIMARSKVEARRHLTTTMELLVALGFIIHLKKSTLSPTHFLVSYWTIALPKHKLHPVKEMVRQMANQRTTLRELASLLGMMVAPHPTILPAPLQYRHLESAKSRGLWRGHTYEVDLEIDPNMESDLKWWLNNSR